MKVSPGKLSWMRETRLGNSLRNWTSALKPNELQQKINHLQNQEEKILATGPSISLLRSSKCCRAKLEFAKKQSSMTSRLDSLGLYT